MNSIQIFKEFIKKMLPRLTKIQKIEPFKVSILWNNAEIREIDFEPLFLIWAEQKDENLLKLRDFAIFKHVSISESRTLEWKNVPITFTFKGKKSVQSLELDPDVLYQNSVLIRQIDHISIGSLLKKAREEMGLSQTQVAANAGTTRHYISRIENEQSEIQMDTLQKIIELGLGKKMRLEII